MSDLIDDLPIIRGKYRQNFDISKVSWFQVGGHADVMFRPADIDDLVYFLQNKNADIPVVTLGLCSNIIVRDAGINGVVIRLGAGFVEVNIINLEDISTVTDYKSSDKLVQVGAGCVNANLVKICADNGIGGLEFLSGIPGCIGGALAMNAGAYGVEIKDIFVEATGVDSKGNIHKFNVDDMGFIYRNNNVADDIIFTSAILQGMKEEPQIIKDRITDISQKREQSQPIRAKTGGSTFKNPKGYKAWQLIDDAGCRGLKIGDAEMSHQHCNFMINTGNATASDLENLGEIVRKKVKENSGVELQWEIKFISG